MDTLVEYLSELTFARRLETFSQPKKLVKVSTLQDPSTRKLVRKTAPIEGNREISWPHSRSGVIEENRVVQEVRKLIIYIIYIFLN